MTRRPAREAIPMQQPDTSILRLIDHSVLSPAATRAEVEAACDLGLRLRVAAVCVQPCWAELAADRLRDTEVKAASVLSFPHGTALTEVKLVEAVSLLRAGVGEIDMVANLGWIKSGRVEDVADEIAAVHVLLVSVGVKLKVILETGYLTDAEKASSAHAAAAAGADFVKTSTGFGPSGATVEDVRLLRASVPEEVGVKAAGGIRTLAQAAELVAAGASRLGTSATATIAAELGVEA
jgi:deoxyribose-phosphate aldolase